MNYSDLAALLSQSEKKNIYLRFSPDVFDFTDRDAAQEIHFFIQGNLNFSLLLTDQNLPIVISMLKLSIFSKDNKFITWDWKSFVTYVVAKTGKPLHIDAAVIDLKVLELYAGQKNKSPDSLSEAMLRVKHLISSGIWKEVDAVYKNIHLPLMTTVLPHLETSGILDTLAGAKVFAHYELNGQENGRLLCFNAFKNGFVPHAMKPETRESLKPRNYDELFLNFDFKGMEVFVLAWLSKDPLLQELCASDDVYTGLYSHLFGVVPNNKNDRELVKKSFLPVIYGQSAYSLSQRSGIAIDLAEKVVERISSLFSTAFSFVLSYQEQLKQNGFVKDIFGKRRYNFESGKEYLVRNFCIQAPAATICLEKLIHLYFALKDKTDLAYTVHDGYFVYANKKNWQEIFKIGTEILTSESDLCPGLRLKIACRGGRNLNNLKPLARKGE